MAINTNFAQQDLMLDDLGLGRRKIFETDYKENKRVTSNARLQYSRLHNQEGTEQARLVKGKEGILSNWNNAWGTMQQDGTAEENLDDIGTGFGQSHRQKLNYEPSVREWTSEEQFAGRRKDYDKYKTAQKKPVPPTDNGVGTKLKRSGSGKQLGPPPCLPASARSKASIIRKRVVKGSSPPRAPTPTLKGIVPSIDTKKKGNASMKQEEPANTADSFKRQERIYTVDFKLSDPSTFMTSARQTLAPSKALAKYATSTTPSQSTPPVLPTPAPDNSSIQPIKPSGPEAAVHPSPKSTLPSDLAASFAGNSTTREQSHSAEDGAPQKALSRLAPGFSFANASPKTIQGLLPLLKACTSTEVYQEFSDYVTSHLEEEVAADAPTVVAEARSASENLTKDVESIQVPSSIRTQDESRQLVASQKSSGVETPSKPVLDSKVGTVSAMEGTETTSVAPKKPAVVTEFNGEVSTFRTETVSTGAVSRARSEGREAKPAQWVRFENPPEAESRTPSKSIEAIMLEALNNRLKSFVHQERTNKYTCCIDECWKAFSSEEFWLKHVHNKHRDCFERLKAKASNYAQAKIEEENASSKNTSVGLTPTSKVQSKTMTQPLVSVVAANKVPDNLDAGSQLISRTDTSMASAQGKGNAGTPMNGLRMAANMPPILSGSRDTGVEGSKSLSQSLARHSEAWRDYIVGEHVQKTRFRPNPARASGASSDVGDAIPKTTSSKVSETPVAMVTSKIATINPFGAPKRSASSATAPTMKVASKVTQIPTVYAPSPPLEERVSTFADPGRAARLQYSGQPAAPLDTHASKPASDLPQQPTRRTLTQTENIPPPISTPAQRVTSRSGTAPSLPAFLRGAGASIDAGEAARRQYGGKADPLEVARKRGI